MDSFTFNLSGTVREETYNDAAYLVADATLIVPGVLNGSHGPLFYPPDEVGKNVEAWNGVPVIVLHPPKGKAGKDVVESQGIGHVANAAFTDDKLHASLWFNVERTKALEPRIYEAVSNFQKMELSTGLGMDAEPADAGAVFNNPTDGPQKYTHIVRNYRPDHVAILAEQIGACSLRDGCGVNNELSHTDIRESLRLALEERFGAENIWVEELFTKKVIFSHDGRLMRLSFKKGKDTVVLSDDEAEPVQRVTSFKIVNASEQGGPSMALTVKQKKAVVNELIENECCWEEEHREELMGLSDVVLNQTKAAADKQAASESLLAAAEAGFNDDRDSITFNQEKKAWEREMKPAKKDEDKTVDNAIPATRLSREEFLALAPDGVRNSLLYAEEAEQAERKRLIEQITVNVSDDTKPDLVATFGLRPLSELRTIASLLPSASSVSSEPNHYGGQPAADVGPTANEANQDDQLIPAELDFAAA